MSGRQVTISASAPVPAPPAIVYAVIADYRDGHARILPPQITDLEVESGGTGTGTVIRYAVTLGGRRVRLRATVEEPEPGRVLIERALQEPRGATRFIVEPAGPDGSHVTITTEWTARGLSGRVQAWLAERLFPPMYHEELRRLGAVAAEIAARDR